MLAIFMLNETEYIYRICQIFVARFRIWGGLSNALGRLSLPKPPRGTRAVWVISWAMMRQLGQGPNGCSLRPERPKVKAGVEVGFLGR